MYTASCACFYGISLTCVFVPDEDYTTSLTGHKSLGLQVQTFPAWIQLSISWQYELFSSSCACKLGQSRIQVYDGIEIVKCVPFGGCVSVTVTPICDVGISLSLLPDDDGFSSKTMGAHRPSCILHILLDNCRVNDVWFDTSSSPRPSPAFLLKLTTSIYNNTLLVALQ